MRHAVFLLPFNLVTPQQSFMAHDLTIPDPAVILDLLEAFRRSKTMFAAVALGVFDQLDARPQTLTQLSSALPADADGLERLLDACVGLQLLERAADGTYANTPAARTYLCSHSPRRLTGYINYSNSVMWKLWSHLEDAVRDGHHCWKQAYGWDGPIFSHFFRTEEAKREFLMGMHGFGLISSPHVVAAFDLTPFTCLVDLGEATGHLAEAACQRYPHLQGVVFDLPEAVPLAREIQAASPVGSRLRVVAGDFFADPLPAADLYALGRIVHDWTEEKVLHLLERIAAHLPSGGGLLIAEKILWEDKTGPRWAQMQSLNMLSCTEGKERTLAEYEALLAKTGFQSVQAVRTSAPLDALLARKA
jgi:acetylserotonin O-methyltransferase